MKNLYEVTHDIKANCTEYSYLIHIEADTAKEARDIAEHLWYRDSKSHMFHIKTRRVRETEIVDMAHYFVRVVYVWNGNDFERVTKKEYDKRYGK